MKKNNLILIVLESAKDCPFDNISSIRDLSSNSLSGPVPSSLGDLTQLENLYEFGLKDLLESEF